MPTKTYKIRLVIDDIQSQMAAKASVNGQAQIEKAVKARGDTEEKTAKRIAKTWEQTFDASIAKKQRESAAFIKAEDSKSKAAEKAVNDVIRAADRQMAADARRDAKAHLALDRWRVAQMKVMGSEHAGLERSDALAGAFVGRLGAIAAGYVGISAVMSGISSAWDKALASSAASLSMVHDYREALLELAALKGSLGQTTRPLLEDLKFRAQTLQTKEGAIGFQTRMLGVGESAIDKPGLPGTISQGEFDKFKVLAGRFQAAEGGDTGAHALLAGTIPLMFNRRLTGDEAFQKETQMYNILKPGGATFSEGAAGLAKLTPYTRTGVISPERGAAVLSALSVSNPTDAATVAEQFIRATSGSMGRLRGPKVEGGEKVGPWLKKLGATEGMDPIQIAEKILPDFIAKRTAGGANFDPLMYLGRAGYGNVQDKTAILNMLAMMESGQFAQFTKLAETTPTVQESVAPLDKFRNDPTGRRRTADVSIDMAKAAQGVLQEPLDLLNRALFARLVASGKATGEYEAYGTDRNWFGMQEAMRLRDARNVYISDERKRLGLEPHDLGRTTFMGPLDKAQFYSDELKDIQAHRGNTDPDMSEVVRALEKILAATEVNTAAVNAMGGPATPDHPQPLAQAPSHGASGSW